MTCLVAVCLFAIGCLLAPVLFFRFPPQNLADVTGFVRSVDRLEVEDLASDMIEENLRSSLPRDRFKVEQRKRVLLLFEYLRRMSFNAWVLLAWAYREQLRIEKAESPGDIVPRLIEEVLAAGTSFRIHSLIILARLSIQIFLNRLRIAPLPRPGRLLRIARTDALSIYRELTDAATKLAACDGPDASNRLTAALFGKSA